MYCVFQVILNIKGTSSTDIAWIGGKLGTTSPYTLTWNKDSTTATYTNWDITSGDGSTSENKYTLMGATGTWTASTATTGITIQICQYKPT